MKNEIMSTYAGGGGRSSSGTSNETGSRPAKYGTGSAGGFTMAEILLSLTIIGVVAAITLPSLTGNINERTWNTQRKALYARMSQAIALMPSLNGYGTIDATTDTAAETFVTEGLSKVLKINNICDADHLEDCGIPDKITNLKGELVNSTGKLPDTFHSFNAKFSLTSVDSGTYSQINTNIAAFETANGESIAVYYNPSCQGRNETTAYHFVQSTVCANFVYDLNGSKGPNTVGKDIGFITALYSSDSSVVAPFPSKYSAGLAYTQINSGSYCNSLENSRLPNADEAASLFTNRLFLHTITGAFWTSSTLALNGGTGAWRQSLDTGGLRPLARDAMPPDGAMVYCLQR